jgi:hypothetical protein
MKTILLAVFAFSLFMEVPAQENIAWPEKDQAPKAVLSNPSRGNEKVEITFTKVTQGPVVTDGGWCYAMAWADFNNDSYPDLFVTNNDANNGQHNFLYMNNGNGTFTKITGSPVFTDGGSSYGCSAADFNNDGNTDLFVSNYNENNFLYVNNGDGTFAKVTQGPVVTNGGKSVGAAFADYDRDGWLDLYVCNRNEPNFLYHNLGNGTFERITTGSIVTDIDNSSGCAWGDYDNDGWPDLIVVNVDTPNCLYHNNGNGTFTKITEGPVVTDLSKCSGASWGDCNNDGYLDLFISTGVLGTYNDLLYLNNGNGTFTRVTDSPVVNELTWSSGSAWGDYDKDGDLDLVAGGYDGYNRLFQNNGNGTFVKVLGNALVNDGSYVEGLAWADIDNDGDLDIFTARNNYFSGNNALYINNGNENRWLKVKCQGVISNAGAIGAKIRVYAHILGQSTLQFREISTQSGGGQGGENELVQFFGMGDAQETDSITVWWPSGTTQRIEATATNQLITLTEPVTTFILSGTITYANSAQTPLSGVTVALKNSSGTVIATTSSNATGVYAFSGLQNGNYTLEPSTSKLWGGVTALDVLLYKKHIASIAFLEGIFLASGDVNGSGSLTATDVLLIKKRIGFVSNSFTVGDWLFNNTPVIINGGNVNKNFSGLCYGDANGSFIPQAKEFPSAGRPKIGVMSIGSVPARIGEIPVPLIASGLVNLGSFQYSILYDPSILTFTHADHWCSGIENVVVGNPQPGKLTFVWAADASGISITDEIFCDLHFISNSIDPSEISWSDMPTIREVADSEGAIFAPNLINGTVGGNSGFENTIFSQLVIYPNPAKDFVMVRSTGELQSVRIFNNLGEVVYDKALTSKELMVSTSFFRPGLYLMKVQTMAGIESKKLVIQ